MRSKIEYFWKTFHLISFHNDKSSIYHRRWKLETNTLADDRVSLEITFFSLIIVNHYYSANIIIIIGNPVYSQNIYRLQSRRVLWTIFNFLSTKFTKDANNFSGHLSAHSTMSMTLSRGLLVLASMDFPWVPKRVVAMQLEVASNDFVAESKDFFSLSMELAVEVRFDDDGLRWRVAAPLGDPNVHS